MSPMMLFWRADTFTLAMLILLTNGHTGSRRIRFTITIAQYRMPRYAAMPEDSFDAYYDARAFYAARRRLLLRVY